MDYGFEQRGRRPLVALAMVLGIGIAALGFSQGAPWYFTAIPALSALMALAVFAGNSHSGLILQGDTLTLFKDRWRHAIPVAAIRGVRVSRWSEGQADVWLDLENAPPYRLPGYCFGSAVELTDAFRKRGITVS